MAGGRLLSGHLRRCPWLGAWLRGFGSWARGSGADVSKFYVKVGDLVGG